MLTDVPFTIYLVIVSILAGSVAAISGFGIGSLLTPLLSLKMGTKIAIAAVAIPHLIGTLIRFWILRKKVDKKIFIRFGISSVLGGLLGAFLFWQSSSPTLTILFAAILIFASVTELSGATRKIKVGKKVALIGGFISGFLGGLVGNQGGIRSAALLSFEINQETFVATATAIGVVVDLIRMPIYFASEYKSIFQVSNYIILAIVGVLIGTYLGLKILNFIPKEIFRRLVAILILILGLFMLYKGISRN